MIERLRPCRQPLVCLDFGHERVSAIELIDGAVTRWDSRPLAEDVLRNGDPVHPTALGDAVRRLLMAAGIAGGRARMALPDEATVSRHVTLPAMPGRDLRRAVHFAAERHLPFPIDRARWSWDVVERTPEQVTVYLVATWRDVADHYAEVARSAGLTPEVLEPRGLAVARALDQQQALLVDAGSRRLYATLLVAGQPTFFDEIVAGSTHVDRRDAMDRLLQRAYRQQSSAAGRRLAPVLLGGGVDASTIPLSVAGRPVTDVLNGHLPAVPADFRPGDYLADVGLSMRAGR